MAKKIKQEPVLQRDQLILKVIELQKQGHHTPYIKKQLHEITKDTYTVQAINEICVAADKQIESEYLNKAKDIILLHTGRYHREVNRLMRTTELDENLIGLPTSKGGVTYKQWVTSRNRKIKAMDRAINVLGQLENILGLSHESLTSVDIQNNININVTEANQKTFDVTKLTFDEQVELLGYMKKTKVSLHEEPQGVIEIIREPEQQITEDIEAEILPANIEQIKQVALAPDQSHVSLGSTDPLSKLKERLKVIAAQTISNAGGNLDADELKLINES